MLGRLEMKRWDPRRNLSTRYSESEFPRVSSFEVCKGRLLMPIFCACSSRADNSSVFGPLSTVEVILT